MIREDLLREMNRMAEELLRSGMSFPDREATVQQHVDGTCRCIQRLAEVLDEPTITPEMALTSDASVVEWDGETGRAMDAIDELLAGGAEHQHVRRRDMGRCCRLDPQGKSHVHVCTWTGDMGVGTGVADILARPSSQEPLALPRENLPDAYARVARMDARQLAYYAWCARERLRGGA